ncbi:sodium:proton antiporter [Phreatobacter aquaticus]|uniref:Sodium:proton antiporter n=1 Tax=Phreatobacter aquaticus TaxID=2570229 RepID=A0A4D7QFG3_9HYPH|nr:sodium:proton antiporter [Phreatobacter aquaticus]QCK85381.1 sodium:proton antiporter [Phreatobacter aquaticus]
MIGALSGGAGSAPRQEPASEQLGLAGKRPVRLWLPAGIGRGAVLAANALLALVLTASPAAAADGLDGTAMGLIWCLPFVGLLLSIATGPVLYPHVWEHHYGKFALLWAALTVIPLYLAFPGASATAALAHAILLEYLPFIILIFALYTIAGGIVVTGNIHGAPMTNTAILAIGAALASLVGTTGASMVMIRPIIRANDDRVHNVHVVVFFIFIVSNCGGALTPLGDPPLFVGFLKGVDFFWTTKALFTETMLVIALLLAIFYAVDSYLYAKEGRTKPDPTPDSRVGVQGLSMVWLIAVMVAAILLRGYWKPGIGFRVLGVEVSLQDLVSNVVMLGSGLLSLKLGRPENREANGFSWGPVQEVAKLFAGIFICIVPVLAILSAGRNGAAAPLAALVSRPDGTPNEAMYFWLSGLLSSFLDNAPTYLAFFELAGGDPAKLMGPLGLTLAAISTGSVYMGANSYIGNAPNFMVYAIARDRGVAMPSFFGYMLWSGAILVPIFILVTLLFFIRGAPLAGW